MKQLITIEQWQELNQSEQEFILIWKRRKYPASPIPLTIGECIELLIALSYNFHYEYSNGRFFNKILTNPESTIAWDGDELIDILFYEVTRAVKRQLNSAGTYNDNSPS